MKAEYSGFKISEAVLVLSAAVLVLVIEAARAFGATIHAAPAGPL